MSQPIAGGWNEMFLKAPSKPNCDSMVLINRTSSAWCSLGKWCWQRAFLVAFMFPCAPSCVNPGNPMPWPALWHLWPTLGAVSRAAAVFVPSPFPPPCPYILLLVKMFTRTPKHLPERQPGSDVKPCHPLLPIPGSSRPGWTGL